MLRTGSWRRQRWAITAASSAPKRWPTSWRVRLGDVHATVWAADCCGQSAVRRPCGCVSTSFIGCSSRPQQRATCKLLCGHGPIPSSPPRLGAGGNAEARAEDIAIIDVRGDCPFTDWMVLATARRCARRTVCHWV